MSALADTLEKAGIASISDSIPLIVAALRLAEARCAVRDHAGCKVEVFDEKCRESYTSESTYRAERARFEGEA